MATNEQRVDLNLFRIFDAIYSQGGISAAARALHLTQPAVTHALNRLREQFGDPLFVRQGNHMIPTHTARSVITPVQLHLKGLQATLRLPTRFVPQEWELEVTLGLRDLLESMLLPPLRARLAQLAPRLRLLSRRVEPDEVERELSAGRVDLLIDRRRRGGPRLRSEHLLDESLVVVMRPGHPLAATAPRRADYLAAEHVAVSARGEPSTLDVLLGQDGRFRSIRMVCQHYLAAAQVLAGSDLLLTLPRSYAVYLCSLLPLVIQPLPLKLRPFAIELYWHESKQSDQAHAWLRQQLADVLRQLPGMSMPDHVRD